MKQFEKWSSFFEERFRIILLIFESLTNNNYMLLFTGNFIVFLTPGIPSRNYLCYLYALI